MPTSKRERWALCVLVIVAVAFAILLAQPAHASGSRVRVVAQIDGATHLGAFTPDPAVDAKIERVIDMLNEQQGWWSHDYPKGPQLGAKRYDEDRCVRTARAPARGEWSPTTAKCGDGAPAATRLQRAEPADLYRVYLEEREKSRADPVFYIQAADLLLQHDMRPLALRVLSNLAEIDSENRHNLRALAARLLQAEESRLAVALYRRVVSLASEEPQSFLDLGLAYAADGDPQRAIDTLYEVVTRTWDNRFPEIELIALAELNAIVASNPPDLDLGRIDPRLIRSMPVDLRIVLSWNAGGKNVDVDLLVADANGESYRPATVRSVISYQGGRLSRNFTDGYGPEEYTLRVAKPGRYRIVAAFMSDVHEDTRRRSILVRLDVQTKFGTAQRSTRIHHAVLDLYENAVIAEITIPGDAKR